MTSYQYHYPPPSERAVQHILQAIIMKLAGGQDRFSMVEICAISQYKLCTVQRAIRLLDDRQLIAIERGKPGEPFRYRVPSQQQQVKP
jgi:hypothetical protein